MTRTGRPTLPQDQRARVAYNIRLTPPQREKVERLGGAAWIRAQIDAAQDRPQRARAGSDDPT